MDIEKLVEQLRAKSLYTDKASLKIMDLCMDAATALSTLQAENEKLRAERVELEQMASCIYYKQGGLCRYGEEDPANVCVFGPCDYEKSAQEAQAELEQVERERDAAQSLLAERIGVMGADPITTAFGLALDRLRELAQAELKQVKADRSRYRQIAEVQGRRIEELEKIIQDKSQSLDDVPDPIAADERQTSPGRRWDWLLSRFTRRED